MPITTRSLATAALAATLSVVGTVAPLHAQRTAGAAASPRANTRNLMLGFSASGTSITSPDLEDESASGGGASMQLGWGFSRLFTLLVDASGADLDADRGENFTLVHFDLLARFNFTGPRRPWVAFVEGGLSGRVAGEHQAGVIEDNGNHRQVNLEISGGGVTIGGGAMYFVVPTLALGAGLKFTTGEFNTVKFNNISVDGFELDATSTRLNLGLTWYPLIGRR